MSDSTIKLVSDFESDTSFDVIMGTFADSHLPPLAHYCMEIKVIHLSEDFTSERAYGNFLEENASSLDSFEVFLSD